MASVLTDFNIRNFQSLRKVDLSLGKLTVIVGPSSSGKSAVVRALRTLTSNSRGGSFITHGARKTLIQAVLAAGEVVFIREGSGSSYRLARSGQPQQVHTKLAGGVPEAVSGLLGLSEALQIAGQFDKPFLLDASGGEVARVLGELTNVSVIFEAARESNKRKLNANATLKIRQSDLNVILVKLEEFRELPAQIKKLNEAEDLLAEAKSLNNKVSALSHTISLIEHSEQILNSLPSSSLAVPDLTALEEARDRLARFKSLIRSVSAFKNEEFQMRSVVENETQTVLYLENGMHEILVKAGICPTCRQRIQ